MHSRLPRNVVHTIISLVDDRATLCRCALSGRELLPASRLNLLYDVAITPAKFNHLACMGSVEFLAPYFYSLQLCDDRNEPWIHTFFDRFSLILLHLRYLVLMQLQAHMHPVIPSDSIPRHRYASLTTLTISNGTFQSFPHLQTLVCAFPHVIRLIIEGVEWKRSCGDSSDLALHGPLLEQLWFNARNEGDVTTLVDWILCTPSAHSIRDLSLCSRGVLNAYDMPAVERLAESLGPSLEHFEISLRHCSQNDGVNLSSNTCLRSLYVRDVGSGTWDSFALLLGQRISPAALTCLSVDLHIPTAEDLHAFEVDFQAGLDNILPKKAFSRLQAVTVWLRSAPPSMTPLELVNVMELCRPTLPSGCVYQVKPWWDLRSGQHSA
ncbi:hypothetical protein BD309DRAFT_397611 [Dichomitus squalens]|nr:hypothetical protein BD309DRAFT_397611 [Dichomitus squalens]